MVMLQSQNYDDSEYHNKYLPCSHIMTACKSVNVDVDPRIMCRYYLLYKTSARLLHLLCYTTHWRDKNRKEIMGPNPRRRRSANDCSVSTCILTKTNEDEEENERDTKKMIIFFI